MALIWLDTKVNGLVLKLLHSHFSTFISSLSSHSIIMSATAATTTTTAFEERPVTPDQPITRHEGDSSCKRRFYTLIDFRSPHTTKKLTYQRLRILKRTGER